MIAFAEESAPPTPASPKSTTPKQVEAQTAPALSAAERGRQLQEGRRSSRPAHSIETLKGAERRGTDEDGNLWATMPANYGYFLGTLANDGDHVDVFIGPKPEAGMFWVVNQNKVDLSKHDEPKVMLWLRERGMAQADHLASFPTETLAGAFA